MDGKPKPTLADVAGAAGVSKMTASRALRRAPDVSARTITRVTKAAELLGYVGNPLAASLSGQRSDLIGVVVPSLHNIVFAEVLAGIADGLDGTGKQPVFGVTDYDPARERDVIRKLLSWQPAGLIVAGLDQPDDIRALLKAADIPIVQIMDLDGDPVDACVGLSHHDAGRDMARALTERGLRAFGYVGCGLDRDTRAAKRLRGFEAGLKEAGVSLKARALDTGLSTLQGGRSLTQQLLKKAPTLDCIYFSNDDLAAGGVYHCLASGIAVPDQLTLAGFNGLDLVGALPVHVATSLSPRRDIGRSAAEIVLNDRAGQGRRIAMTPRILF